MDDSYGTRGHGEVQKPERKSSGNEMAVHDKRKKRRHGTYSYLKTPRSSRRKNPLAPIDPWSKGARFSPYPQFIPDADLYDPPASSSNKVPLRTDLCVYTGGLFDEEEYDMCELVASPFSTIEPPFDMPEAST